MKAPPKRTQAGQKTQSSVHTVMVSWSLLFLKKGMKMKGPPFYWGSSHLATSCSSGTGGHIISYRTNQLIPVIPTPSHHPRCFKCTNGWSNCRCLKELTCFAKIWQHAIHPGMENMMYLNNRAPKRVKHK